jgi:hypothetical protein
VAELGQRCTHPWLRVTCGVCGEAVDALGETPAEHAAESSGARRPAERPAPAESPQAYFIVARGHPELIDQLRRLMGHVSGVRIIEDRRERPRAEATPEEAREVRKRLREEGHLDQG